MKLGFITLGIFALVAVVACQQDCPELGFRCHNSGRCISLKWVCDGENDCGDWSDEPEDTSLCPTCADFDQFACDNGNCIYKWFLCDGIDHCGDNSDEPEDAKKCPDCRHEYFKCWDGECIDLELRCNGVEDCSDGHDEFDNPNDCPACSEYQFRCKTGMCVNSTTVCNGNYDCNDWSDESEEQCPCAENEYRCEVPKAPPGENQAPGACIPAEKVCDADGVWDCPSGSDEANCSVRAK